MKKKRKQYWWAWLHNMTDHRDDEPMKIKASTREEAREVALQHMQNHRFSLGTIRNRKEMLEYDSFWVHISAGQKAVNEDA